MNVFFIHHYWILDIYEGLYQCKSTLYIDICTAISKRSDSYLGRSSSSFLWVIKETHKLVWCWALDTHHIVLYMYMSNQYIIVGLQLVHDSYLGRSSSLLQWVIKMTHHFCSDILHAFGSQLRGVRPITVEPNPIGRESLAWTRTPR